MPTEPTSTTEPLDLSTLDHAHDIFRQLLEAAPDAVIVTDTGGRIAYANRQAYDLFEYELGSLIGKPMEVLVPERLRAAHVHHRQRFAHAPRVRPMGSGLELFGRKQSGAEVPIEISLSPLKTESGVLFSASIRDISKRKQEEADVRRVQQHLLSAVESIQGAFAIFDASDRLVLCNSAYRELLGPAVSGSVTGKSFDELVSACAKTGFDVTDASAELARWAAYHASPRGALELHTRAGQHLRVIERRTPEGGGVTTIFDVTDDVRHEEELSVARSAAEAASAAKSEFLASMSHELRTPLNAILGFAQLLQRDKRHPLSERQLERIEHVLRGGEHLLRLIDDVLDLARIEAGRILVSPEPVGLDEVLSEVMTTLDSLAARTEVRVELRPLPRGATEVVADRTRLKQILMNFGSNAIKYGRPRGSVILSAALIDDGRLRLSVRDDGLGIPEEKQASLFQPFQRAGQETGPIEGTGIGLVISKRLAELMGGTVGFESQAGRGSTFWLDLPRPSPRHVAGTPALSATPATSGGLSGAEGPRYVVVYVEDNPSNIAFMRDLLADFERVELLTAPTAEIGIELVRARRPHVVIMDINLPGMSGLEAAALLKEWPETRDIPIVALSAAAMIRDAARVSQAGFYRYLTKPVKVEELAATLEELLVVAPARAGMT